MRSATLICIGSVGLASAALTLAGPLNPPAGPVAPTYKTLAEVEPRSPIDHLPFTINQPGSYYLTGNLTAQFAGDQIAVRTSYVTIDLNGFSLTGVPGTQTGIAASSQSRVVIRNGRIDHWGGHGIDTTGVGLSLIEHVIVADCGGEGIFAGPSSTITDCQVTSNAWWGIATAEACRIAGCTAIGNGSGSNNGGIYAAPGSIITGCTAAYNTAMGIWLTIDTGASGCTSNTNSGPGIMASDGANIERCVCMNNSTDGVTADDKVTVRYSTCSGNGDDGIQMDDDGTICHNTCHANGPAASGAGVYLTGSRTRIGDNDLVGNRYGILATNSSFSVITSNTAHDNAGGNYAAAAANVIGPIPPGLSNNQWSDVSHWANLEY
jgi:parallel beta-helix repeat protein